MTFVRYFPDAVLHRKSGTGYGSNRLDHGRKDLKALFKHVTAKAVNVACGSLFEQATTGVTSDH